LLYFVEAAQTDCSVLLIFMAIMENDTRESSFLVMAVQFL